MAIAIRARELRPSMHRPTSMRVLGPMARSFRTRNPTVCPTSSPSRSAILRAVALATTLLGTRRTIFFPPPAGILDARLPLCCRYRGLCINAARGTTDVFPAPGGAWRYGMGWRCEQGEMQGTGRGPCEMYAREARGQWRDKRVNPLIAPLHTHTQTFTLTCKTRQLFLSSVWRTSVIHSLQGLK